MSIDTYKITRHTIKFLTKRVKEEAHSMIVVRLYDDDNVNRAIVIFEDHAGAAPPKPTGDHERQQATAYLDLADHRPYLDILRQEKSVYLKMGWTQQGKPACCLMYRSTARRRSWASSSGPETTITARRPVTQRA